MNRRGNPIALLILILLIAGALLQFKIYNKSLYFGKELNKYIESQEARELKTDNTNKKETGQADEGDWLVWAYSVEPKTLNMISADNDIYSRWITTPYILEPLLDYDYDTMELKPFLAESFDISEDGLEVNFKLRDDIYFSDGVPVTTDDVVFTFNTIMNPKIDAATIAQMYTDVDKLVPIDDKQFKFIMKRPFFKTLDNLSFADVGIYPKHIYEFDDPNKFNERNSNPVGSGPYIFEKWDVGREVVLKRNENYWGEKPKIKKVVYRFISNTVAGLQALRAGQVDIMIPEPDQFAELDSDNEFKDQFYYLSYYEPRVPFFYIGWNIDTPYFKDSRVRLAMTHIIDRNKIITHLLKGSGRIVTGPFYSEGNQNDTGIAPWPYDPEKAKALLSEAGWIDSNGDGIRDRDGIPLRFKFMYSTASTLYVRLVKLLKDEAAKIGVDVVPDPYEWSVLIPRLTDRKFEAMVMGWGGDVIDDPYQIFHSSQIGNRASNYVGYNNPEVDSLIEKARMTIDEADRNRLFQKIHLILHEEQPYTFLFERPYMRLLDKRFKNVKMHKMGLNWLEWYVPKELQKYE
ncbi:MAG: ABC transporter substrate-binding protein [Deltaproteobacteria bacterium]|nr:ABC transporter substrate-binding protein [Deltaproteobacteria bacterium]